MWGSVQRSDVAAGTEKNPKKRCSLPSPEGGSLFEVKRPKDEGGHKKAGTVLAELRNTVRDAGINSSNDGEIPKVVKREPADYVQTFKHKKKREKNVEVLTQCDQFLLTIRS